MHSIRVDRLSAAEHAELDHANCAARDGRPRVRALIVLLAAERGIVAAEIAAAARTWRERRGGTSRDASLPLPARRRAFARRHRQG